MKQTIAIFILFTTCISAQIKGVIKDSSTNQPVSYVNIIVENAPKAFSADEQGNFVIDAKSDAILVFSSVGYKSLKIKASEADNVLLLPIVYEISSVSVEKPKKTVSKILSDYNQKDIDLYYANSGNQSGLLARFFSISENLQETPYFKGLTVMTKSKTKNAKFNVHFLEVNPNGTPGAEIARMNIIGVAKKGKQDTYIDLLPFKMRIPENGFFIVLETLIIPENRIVEFSYTDKKSIYHERIYHSPTFGTTRTENNFSTSWRYTENHDWRMFKKVSQEQVQKYYDDFKKATGKDAPPLDKRYSEFAMKVELTN